MIPRPQPTLRLALRELVLLANEDPPGFCEEMYHFGEGMAASKARLPRGPYAAAAERCARGIFEVAREYAAISDEIDDQPELPLECAA